MLWCSKIYNTELVVEFLIFVAFIFSVWLFGLDLCSFVDSGILLICSGGEYWGKMMQFENIY